MDAKIIGYSVSNIVIDSHLIESARKKEISFLRNLKTEEDQIKFFKKSLSQSKPLSIQDVPRNFMWKVDTKGRKSFKVDFQRGLIYLVHTSLNGRIIRAISVDDYTRCCKGFPFEEVAEIEGNNLRAYLMNLGS